MDLTSLIEIVIVIVVIYFFIKLIVSPVIKLILGVIIFLVAIYLLQRFFGFNLDQVLAPFGISLNSGKWGLNLNWILGPANYYIDQIKTFLTFIWGNFPKSINK
jgi:hypothetical protein